MSRYFRKNDLVRLNREALDEFPHLRGITGVVAADSRGVAVAVKWGSRKSADDFHPSLLEAVGYGAAAVPTEDLVVLPAEIEELIARLAYPDGKNSDADAGTLRKILLQKVNSIKSEHRTAFIDGGNP